MVLVTDVKTGKTYESPTTPKGAVHEGQGYATAALNPSLPYVAASGQTFENMAAAQKAGAIPANAGMAPGVPEAVALAQLSSANKFDPNTTLNTQTRPQSTTATPFTGAAGALNISTGQALPTEVFRSAFEQTKATVPEAPQEAGQARSAVQGALQQAMPAPAPQTPLEVESFMQTSPLMQSSLQELVEFLSPASTRKMMEETMARVVGGMQEAAGLKLELANVDNIMAGTEQNIRDEVEKMNGFATESQVLALTVARNKTLLQRAAFIQDKLSYLQDVVNTNLQMYSFQKDLAQQEFQQRSFLLNYKQQNDQFIYNANQKAIERNLELFGADGLYSATGGDPVKIDRLERMMGLVPGGLAAAAERAAAERARALEKEQLDMELTREQIESERFDRVIDREKFEYQKYLDDRKIRLDQLALTLSALTPDASQELLSPNDAALLGVPYGTTKGQAARSGIVPQNQQKTPSVEALKHESNIQSGLQALNDMSKLLRQKGTLKIFLPNAFSQTRKQYFAAADNLVDIIGRMRSGGAITNDEERRFEGLLPKMTDNQGTWVKKLNEIQNLLINASGKFQQLDNIFQQTVGFEGASVNRVAEAIGQFESGGNYKALGPKTRTGDRAYGKYQVMGANIPSWTKAALGKSLTPQQYLNSPKAQDAVAKHKMGEYLKKYGSVENVAVAWFAGPGAVGRNNANKKDIIGTSVPKYVQNIRAIYNKLG